MKQIQTLVEQALQTWEETRDSDRKLMLAVWYLQDPEYETNFRKFFTERAANPETIRRIRQKLQEQGKYPASKKVEDQRFNKFNQMRSYGNASVDYINEILI